MPPSQAERELRAETMRMWQDDARGSKGDLWGQMVRAEEADALPTIDITDSAAAAPAASKLKLSVDKLQVCRGACISAYLRASPISPEHTSFFDDLLTPPPCCDL